MASSDEKGVVAEDPIRAGTGNNSSSQDDEDVIHEYKEDRGYVVGVEDPAAAAGRHVKLAGDGRTRLIPQPSEDPHDPLNWPQRKKNLLLAIVALTALLPDYGSGTGAVTLLQQSEVWHLSEDTVNHASVGNVFMLGAGGVFVVIFCAYFGRLPVMVYFLTIALATAAWTAGAASFKSYMAARILNGFFSTVCQVSGLIVIQDIFFFHERTRKINVWASFFVISPYLGPLLAAFMIATEPWTTPFWVFTAETGLCLALALLLMEETFYDRRIPPGDQPARGTRLQRLAGIAQWRSRHLRNTFGQACMRPLRALVKPTVFLSSLYYLMTFAWVVGINTTLSIFLSSLYHFGPTQIGYFYFTPVVAVILGETAGHWLHDLLARQYIHSHNGRFEPEARLRAIIISTPFMVVGLVILGQSLENGWHYMVTSVAWGLYVFGIMITTTAVSSYNLDCYPEASGEVSAWVNNSRTMGGFAVSYFQVAWATSSGTRISFGVQAAICASAFLLVALLMWRGKAMRLWAGPLRFHTS
ncbi:MFS general substrate transporter [Xylariaceae sp. FL0804]|nr:MFS general substrate transporter [Xylariaceae sp. FL0804]